MSMDVKCLQSIEDVKLSLESVNARDEYNRTPLHIACEFDYVESAELLLSNNADINAKNEDELTPLHIACSNYYFEMIELLLRQGADVNAKDKNGRTALHYVAGKAQEVILGLSSTETKIIQHTVAKMLLNHNADVNSKDQDGRTPLFFAVKENNLEVTNMLLVNRAEVNIRDARGKTPLHSIFLNEESGVDCAGSYYCKCQSKGQRLTLAEIIKNLLEWGADVNAKQEDSGTTILHTMAVEGYEEIVEQLVDFGVDIDAQDSNGCTALHLACQEGQLGIVKTLLKNGSDVELFDKEAKTPSRHAENTCFERIMAEIFKKHDLMTEFTKVYLAWGDASAGEFWSCANTLVVAHYLIFRYYYDSARKDCVKWEKELNRMRHRKINNTTVTFYDILRKSIGGLTKLLNNENIFQTLSSGGYKKEFPEYSGLINARFNCGLRRKKLIGKVWSGDILYDIFPNLPNDCVEKIIGYLGDKDIRTLIDLNDANCSMQLKNQYFI